MKESRAEEDCSRLMICDNCGSLVKPSEMRRSSSGCMFSENSKLPSSAQGFDCFVRGLTKFLLPEMCWMEKSKSAKNSIHRASRLDM